MVKETMFVGPFYGRNISPPPTSIMKNPWILWHIPLQIITLYSVYPVMWFPIHGGTPSHHPSHRWPWLSIEARVMVATGDPRWPWRWGWCPTCNNGDDLRIVYGIGPTTWSGAYPMKDPFISIIILHTLVVYTLHLHLPLVSATPTKVAPPEGFTFCPVAPAPQPEKGLQPQTRTRESSISTGMVWSFDLWSFDGVTNHKSAITQMIPAGLIIWSSSATQSPGASSVP